MQTLKFKIEKQHIQGIDIPNLVSGTKDYLDCEFTFDQSWVGYNKVAIFDQKYYEPIYNNKCKVPNEVSDLKRFSVKIAGEKKEIRVFTDFALINQR